MFLLPFLLPSELVTTLVGFVDGSGINVT